MNELSITLLSLCVLFFHHVTAQNTTDDAVSNFQPSLAVVIAVLGLMFSLTFILLMYAKFCQRNTSVPVLDPENQPTLVRSRSRFSGIDKTVIESLPFFRFSSLKGSKEGLECAVCLSKFEDVEILRLLPKCKHAFHTDCIDHWLEKHSSCPICRHKVNPEDQTILTYSNSSRLQANPSGLGEDSSNIELFVQREEQQQQQQQQHGSSRFSIGSSFRKIIGMDIKEEELFIQKEIEEDSEKGYHKHNHKITISDIVFNHRWSNVSSSDLMFLNTEMLNANSSNRFNDLESSSEFMATRVVENEEIMNMNKDKSVSISDEDPLFASSYSSVGNSSHAPKYMNQGEKRSMSEITGVSRFGGSSMKNKVFRDSSLFENNLKRERTRQLWFPIARRTVQWFVNRETKSQQSQNKQKSLDV
ncbi:hypothetical protein TanjilG_04506 [Lupinus angustifolius]|uniref:RING-type E3 ubiquitin transferase n=1 Tax=Lupinus angustifolius TaxID=3871 RepID=A0A4P1RQR5_LUPAN|nr:PREDICTED: E3 ubiquitin-protein ligase ATL42 [Lupinus angustifolius]OIW15971.1 hypothetical protein TanjilG_04506 [Lupinus angustifolius]